jgi:hypothetical protein
MNEREESGQAAAAKGMKWGMLIWHKEQQHQRHKARSNDCKCSWAWAVTVVSEGRATGVWLCQLLLGRDGRAGVREKRAARGKALKPTAKLCKLDTLTAPAATASSSLRLSRRQGTWLTADTEQLLD